MLCATAKFHVYVWRCEWSVCMSYSVCAMKLTQTSCGEMRPFHQCTEMSKTVRCQSKAPCASQQPIERVKITHLAVTNNNVLTFCFGFFLVLLFTARCWMMSNFALLGSPLPIQSELVHVRDSCRRKFTVLAGHQLLQRLSTLFLKENLSAQSTHWDTQCERANFAGAVWWYVCSRVAHLRVRVKLEAVHLDM